MILIDTNVVSEPLKAVPAPNVISWMDAQAIETLFLSTITVAELRFGIAAMPSGKRQDVLRERLERDVLPVFSGRILSFDLDASQSYSELMARSRSSGKAIGKADGYIAAIAASNRLQVATRDVGPFEAAGLRVIDPWNAI